MKVMGILVTLISLCTVQILGCGDGTQSDGKQLDPSDKYISRIKNDVLPVDKSLTIGEAFDTYSFFEIKKWSTFETGRKRHVVQFTGTFNNGAAMISNELDRNIALAKFTYDLNKKTYNISKDPEDEEAMKKAEASAKNLQVIKESINSIDKLNLVVLFIINKDDSFRIGYSGYELLLQNGKVFKGDVLGKYRIQLLTKIYNNEEMVSGNPASFIAQGMTN